ncbi:TPA: hypothetical protein ACSQRE_000114 [Clostridium perfringens]|uniref:hypothetical protein n=1 Tax=Clostridium perfringens TaxID=1502 RepID=UPI0013A62997|nr:hypothetical protein [Clostridium perfringens]
MENNFMENNFINTFLEQLVAFEKETAILKLSKRFDLDMDKAAKYYNSWRREWCKTC